MSQLARFFHWGPRATEDMTSVELLWWTDQANQMLAKEARRNVRR
jgi:hypothetical protein